MRLKKYQQNSLKVLQSFFEQCHLAGGHEAAFKQIISESEIAERLVNVKNAYTVAMSIPNTPRVCIKVPTGGGKTIIAAHAIKMVAHTWCNKDYPLVLWFTPTDTIRRQTTEALQNPRHPYRIALNGQFEGRVKIFDMDEKFNIRPSDIEENACIIVSTIQSFVKKDTDKYNVYKDNENLESHFVKMPPAKYVGMEMKEGRQRPKYSFSNLLYYHQPVLIIDEAHKVVTELAQGTQGRLNPSAIIEFTATPKENNNTLYNVRASELKDEEMIKLPIILVEHSHWEQAVDEAIARRANLEKDAENEKEYICPIVLFQAQSKDKEVTVDVLKDYLLNSANIPKDQIKIATGEQKELDGVDVFRRDDPTKYIITVEALKEGWDCPFAYILCSLANVKSDTSVTQLLGRVMRMPYAETRKASSLNKAYAYVVSQHFSEAAGILTEKLKEKGFDDNEAKASIQHEQSRFDKNWDTPFNAFTLSVTINKNEIPAAIILGDNNTVYFKTETTDGDIKALCDTIQDEREANSLKWKYRNFKTRLVAESPADKGEKFIVPRLMVELDGQLEFADPGLIFEHYDWNIAKDGKYQLDENDFNIEELPGKGFAIDLKGNRMDYSIAGKDQLLPYMSDKHTWDAANLILWLDRNLKQQDIPQPQMVEWLRKVIEHLLDTHKMSIGSLFVAKFALSNTLLSIITEERKKAKRKSFELFKNDYRKMIDFNKGFEFEKEMYDGIISLYDGNFTFKKHFFNIIPQMNGEEIECAKAIEAQPQVQYWIRNLDRPPNAYCLPTSTDNFCPDFAAKLTDGRTMIIEYKGGNIATNQDAKEKETIGLVWEKQSDGKCLFLIAEQNKNGKTLEQQIKEKIG